MESVTDAVPYAQAVATLNSFEVILQRKSSSIKPPLKICSLDTRNSKSTDLLWILSELLYYLGLVLFAFGIPGLAFSLWSLSLADVLEPDYGYLAIAWIVSLLMFIGGVVLKNLLDRS